MEHTFVRILSTELGVRNCSEVLGRLRNPISRLELTDALLVLKQVIRLTHFRHSKAKVGEEFFVSNSLFTRQSIKFFNIDLSKEVEEFIPYLRTKVLDQVDLSTHQLYYEGKAKETDLTITKVNKVDLW